jgi:glycosyltransferase involved in cell wall biosynthesis
MRIGITLTGDYGWAGGVYYSLNIIKLLQNISLKKNLKIIVIANTSTPLELLSDIPKENIEIVWLDKRTFFYKLLHKIKNDRFIADINALRLDVIYPLMAYDPLHSKLNCRVIYWLYDFQHKFLPELFSKEEIQKRDQTFENIAANAKDIVFSSRDALTHFEQFYLNSQSNKHIFNFVSLLEKIEVDNDQTYDIPNEYCIVCNQFWPHKNHLVVLKALKLLLENQNKMHIVFTGKYDDTRNKSYVDSLKAFIQDEALEPHVTFTGFISRQQQIHLMKNAVAIIQPSLFEGWSTVIEDAKALNKFLIVSDLPVNREQITKNVLFFNASAHVELAGYMSCLPDEHQPTDSMDYQINIEKAKLDLIKLFGI